MKRSSKALLTLLCAVLLVAASVMGTMAYLTDSEAVTNTFTVGSVQITLDEAKVDADGTVVEDEGRVKANTYKLIPGHTYTKDPTIHVDSNSEDCWLFVKVVDEIAAIQGGTAIAAQLTTNGWTAVDGVTNVYAYKETVSGGSNVKVFENFEIDGEADVAAYAGKTITVTAYAIQADGFDSAAEAWNAAGLN